VQQAPRLCLYSFPRYPRSESAELKAQLWCLPLRVTSFKFTWHMEVLPGSTSPAPISAKCESQFSFSLSLSDGGVWTHGFARALSLSHATSPCSLFDSNVQFLLGWWCMPEISAEGSQVLD
jgi:hypothetical protein